MEIADVVRLVGAGVVMLGVVAAALVVGIVRADRDERRRWADDLELGDRLARLWAEAGDYLRNRPLDPPVDDRPTVVQPRVAVDPEPTRELIRHRCPHCNAPAATGPDGLLRCLERCQTPHMRRRRWSA